MGESPSVSRRNEKTGKWETSSRKKMDNYIKTTAMRGARRNKMFMNN